MIIDAPTIRLGVGTMGLALLMLIFIYIAARLGTWGVARSWWDFWKDKNNNKGGSNDQQRKN